jgi:hypothetical protein
MHTHVQTMHAHAHAHAHTMMHKCMHYDCSEEQPIAKRATMGATEVTGLAPPTSAPGLGPPLPLMHQDWAQTHEGVGRVRRLALRQRALDGNEPAACHTQLQGRVQALRVGRIVDPRGARPRRNRHGPVCPRLGSPVEEEDRALGPFSVEDRLVLENLARPRLPRAAPRNEYSHGVLRAPTWGTPSTHMGCSEHPHRRPSRVCHGPPHGMLHRSTRCCSPWVNLKSRRPMAIQRRADPMPDRVR